MPLIMYLQGTQELPIPAPPIQDDDPGEWQQPARINLTNYLGQRFATDEIVSQPTIVDDTTGLDWQLRLPPLSNANVFPNPGFWQNDESTIPPAPLVEEETPPLWMWLKQQRPWSFALPQVQQEDWAPPAIVVLEDSFGPMLWIRLQPPIVTTLRFLPAGAIEMFPGGTDPIPPTGGKIRYLGFGLRIGIR